MSGIVRIYRCRIIVTRLELETITSGLRAMSSMAAVLGRVKGIIAVLKAFTPTNPTGIMQTMIQGGALPLPGKGSLALPASIGP